jgi:hypothetical protein
LSRLLFLLDVDTVAIINNLIETKKDPKAGQYVPQFWILVEDVVEAMAYYYGDHQYVSFSFGKKTRVLPGALPYFQGLLEVSRDWLIGLDVSNITNSLINDQCPIVEPVVRFSFICNMHMFLHYINTNFPLDFLHPS